MTSAVSNIPCCEAEASEEPQFEIVEKKRASPKKKAPERKGMMEREREAKEQAKRDKKAAAAKKAADTRRIKKLVAEAAAKQGAGEAPKEPPAPKEMPAAAPVPKEMPVAAPAPPPERVLWFR